MPGAKQKAAANPTKVVLYTRVSSKEQEKEGYSIPAQQRLLLEYAQQRGMTVAEEFVEIETAKQAGRTAFTAMLEYLKKHGTTCRTILVEKTDRLYRNLKDWTILDDAGITIHLVKEGRIIGPDSGSADHFIHGINVLVARNHILNLGEETAKGQREKARSGVYPSYAPIGYRNVDGPSGKRTIVPDPEKAPAITEVFERFAHGEHSVKRLVEQLRSEGFILPGRRLGTSLVHQILRKRIYTGDFDWNGTTYAGKHEPLVTRECWGRVQTLLDDRAEKKTRKVKHEFAYTGLIHCGHCGCLMVGELKKGKYVYYHCTGNRGKCPEPYTRQEVLTSGFASIFQELIIPPSVLEWLRDSVVTSDQAEQAARARAIKTLKTRHDQIQARIEVMYLDKLDGRITAEFFDKNSDTWRKEQDRLFGKIQDIQKAAPTPIDQAVDMVRLTSRASELFLQQSATEQRRLLQVVVGNAAWQDGTLRTTLFEPFEILRRSNSESNRKEKENSGSMTDMKIWLLR